jgi:nickel-dependent lactate racemase
LESLEVTGFVQKALAAANLDGKRICLVVPDGTRTCPLPMLLQAARQELAGRAKEVTVVIALGTHQGMTEEHLASHLGYRPEQAEDTYPGWRILNHESWLPETFTTLGTIGADRLTDLTGGLMTDTSVEVKINRTLQRPTSRSWLGRCSRTRWSASPAGTSTSFLASQARR